jgi:hypothetical protein
MKKLIVIAVAGLMIPALGLAQEGKKWRIHLSVFTASVPRTEFANSFGTEGTALWVFESEDGSQGFVRSDSKAGFGFSLGFSYDVTSLVQFGPGEMATRAYLEFALAPSFTYAGAPEWEHLYVWDESAGGYFESVYEHVQSGRKASFYGLTLGAVITPFRKIPVSLDLNAGLWRWHLEYVSETAAAYGTSLDMAFIEDYLGGEYKGNGKWEKNIIGPVVGVGLRFGFLKYFSLDLMAKFPMMTTRQAWTGLYNVLGDPIRSRVYGSGNLWGIGLSVYY